MSRPGPQDEDRAALAAEYVLGLLSAEEARAFEAAMAADPALRAEYAFWAGQFAALAAEAPAERPPPALFARIEDRLFPEARQSLWRRLGILPALAGAVAAGVLVLLVTQTGLFAPSPAFSPAFRAEIASEDRSLVVLAAFDPARNLLSLTPQAGGPPEGRVLELWLIEGVGPPVSLGLQAPAGETRLAPAAGLAERLGRGVLAISEEPPGGSPTGAPTGAVLGLGPVVAL